MIAGNLFHFRFRKCKPSRNYVMWFGASKTSQRLILPWILTSRGKDWALYANYRPDDGQRGRGWGTVKLKQSGAFLGWICSTTGISIRAFTRMPRCADSQAETPGSSRAPTIDRAPCSLASGDGTA
jgi:hypothetical protein